MLSRVGERRERAEGEATQKSVTSEWLPDDATGHLGTGGAADVWRHLQTATKREYLFVNGFGAIQYTHALTHISKTILHHL